MPAFAGVDHISLTVSDLDRSQRFYTEVLGFMVVMDFGYGRLCIHPQTGFSLGLMTHAGGTGQAFTERTIGLDHLGLAAASREELVEWERRFDAHGVTYTPIRDMELASHLNFRDPDGIALEFSVANDVMTAALQALRTGDLSRAEILAWVEQHVGAEYVPG